MRRPFIIFLLLLHAAAALSATVEARNSVESQKVVAESAKLEKLGGDMGFLEGPVWFGNDQGYLVFSDIPGDELKKWSKEGGLVTFRKPSNKANGNTSDPQGRLVSAEHGARRISRTEKSGVVTIVDTYEGKKLNSPNDVVVKSDGSIYFTDPDYGLERRPKEQEANHVFRYDPASKKLTSLVNDFDKPNGLCLSPNEQLLYVADSGRPRHIRVFDLQQNGTLSNGRVFATIDKGGPDGIRCDRDGRIWSSAGDGVHIFGPDGSLIGKILVPESPANLAFGGREGKDLFITARKSLYVITTKVTGAARP